MRIEGAEFGKINSNIPTKNFERNDNTHEEQDDKLFHGEVATRLASAKSKDDEYNKEADGIKRPNER